VCAFEAVDCLLGCANDRFVVVERGIQQDRYAGEGFELLDDLPVQGRARLKHGLRSASAVDVRYGRDDVAFVRPNRVDPGHEGILPNTLEILARRFRQYRWCKWSKRLAMLDACV